MTIRSHSLSLANLLLQGTFEPAPVQREFQWQQVHVRQLLEDLLGAFQRAGMDPEPHGPAPRPAAGGPRPDPATVAGDDADPFGDRSPPGEPTAGEADQCASTDEAADAAAPPAFDGERLADSRALPAPRRPADSYYLGGIILLPAPRRERHFYVYDGLQRLTTLSLLLARLRDSWGPQSKAEKRRLEGLLLLKAADGEPAEARLAMPTPGATLAFELRRSGPRRRRNLSLSDARMREAADYCSGIFGGWSDRRRAALLRFLADRVLFTATKVDNASLAYQMFVAANARGLALEVGDILKGQLVEQAHRSGGRAAQIDAIAAGWRAGQRTLRKGFGDFVAALEAMKFRPASRHTSGELLLGHFKSGSADDIERWVAGEYSQLVAHFQLARQHLAQPASQGIDLAFRRLSFLGWKEWQPFYLALGLACADRSGPLWQERIEALQRACYVIELLNWSERTRRRRFLAALHQLEHGHDPFAWRLPDGDNGALHLSFAKLRDAARAALRGPLIGDEKRGTIVRYVETLHWSASLPRHATDDANVEHVLPRTPIGHWERDFSDDERERLTNRLGNLCLIPKPVNDAIGNSEWPLKEAAYRRLGERFRGVQLVLKASEFVRAPDRPTTWNVLAIEQLTEHLAGRAERALGLVRQ